VIATEDAAFEVIGAGATHEGGLRKAFGLTEMGSLVFMVSERAAILPL
jgi:hypothetical protein